MTRRAPAGLTLLDLVIVIGFLALLVYLVRLDWRRVEPAPAPAAHGALAHRLTAAA